jgi:hypothetical protein
MLGTPAEGPVRVFASLLPPALVFGVQFISGVLLPANLFVPLATVPARGCYRQHSHVSHCHAAGQHCPWPGL